MGHPGPSGRFGDGTAPAVFSVSGAPLADTEGRLRSEVLDRA